MGEIGVNIAFFGEIGLQWRVHFCHDWLVCPCVIKMRKNKNYDDKNVCDVE